MSDRFQEIWSRKVMEKEKKFFYQGFSIEISVKFLLIFCQFLFTCEFAFDRASVGMGDPLWVTQTKL